MKHLKDNKGKDSSMRWVFIIGMIYSMLVSVGLTLLMNWTSTEFVLVFSTTTGMFMGGKISQKAIEKDKIEPKILNDEPKIN